jgi:hypothetical protein
LVDVISRAAEGRCRRLSWKPLQRRDRADRDGLARGGGISRGARSHWGAGGLSRILRRMLPRKDCPVAYWAAAGAEAANSRAAARAPAALIQWRRGKDAILDRHRGAGTTPRVHSAVDQESLRAIELTRRLGPSRNGNVLGLTGP